MSMETPQASAPDILDALRSGDNDAARSAAFSAGDLALAEAIPFLCERIKSGNIGVQEAAEYGLRKIRGPRAIEALLPLLASDEAPVRNVAMDILREIGVDAIDAMQPYLRGDDADQRIFITDILGYCRSHKSALLLGEALLKDPEVNVRYQAAVSLGNLAFPESVGSLCQAMHDEEWVQFAVVEALAKINDPAAISALIKLLPLSSVLVSAAIVDALGELGDIKTVPMLFNALENVNVILRHKIVKAIVQILSGRSLSLLAPKSQERLRVYLLDALTDNDEEIQIAALQGLSSIGTSEASNDILTLAHTIDPERQAELYEAAIRALAAIGYNDVVRDALRSDDETRIMIAMEACQLMDDKRPLEEFKNLFWRVSRELQRAAVAEVAHLGSCDDVPFFLSIIDECSDAEVLKSALAFFGNQHTCPDVEDVVFNQLDHRYVDVKEMALEACINLHSPALNERFKERARSDDVMQRMMAVYALGRYSVTENIAEITDALEDADPAIRRVAVEAFLNMGTAAERYLPRLLPRLFDEDKDVRLALVDLLGQIGTPAVMPHLVTALRDENDWVRIRAIEALGVNKNTEAVPTLAEMLEHAEPMVVFRIIEALGRIGGNVAFSVLLGMTDHEDPEIQHAAADAVAAIQAEQE
ncbi:HEAT repeat domain-containing protein [uncultured Desulfovibrio sp.]|uniref:HEAT repeat domain-containing protein n=1 Tax=uncultured Desulfovibrio sp. TaxID=167968 RepID=UPI0026F0BD59|nr:HEAT repeat domain-containing protein [uncultured Desulfovibrio sp.]